MNERERAEYVGRAGHLATMSEFLWRGYNVAIPEVDRGDDIFVVHDATGELYRVQVKTATGKPYTARAGCHARFSVTYAQLALARQPDLNYVFAVRHAGRWEDWFLATRNELYALHQKHGIGHRAGGNVLFRFALLDGNITCNGLDLTPHRDAWDRYWPALI